MTNYSGSKCPKCENTAFEVVSDLPLKTKFQVSYIRCVSCKTIVGTQNREDISSMLRDFASKAGLPIDN